MARRLIWSPRALDELDEIVAWIARDSAVYAQSVIEKFFDRSDGLPAQPGQGRRVLEYSGPDEMREVFVHRWRMIYAVHEDRVEIVTLVHGARLLENVPPL